MLRLPLGILFSLISAFPCGHPAHLVPLYVKHSCQCRVSSTVNQTCLRFDSLRFAFILLLRSTGCTMLSVWMLPPACLLSVSLSLSPSVCVVVFVSFCLCSCRCLLLSVSLSLSPPVCVFCVCLLLSVSLSLSASVCLYVYLCLRLLFPFCLKCFDLSDVKLSYSYQDNKIRQQFTHTHTHARTHARTHAHTLTHIHTII